MIGAGQAAVEGEVLLDEFCDACHGGYRDQDAFGVIGVADGQPESLGKGVHAAQIDLGEGRRVLGGAVQQGDVAVQARTPVGPAPAAPHVVDGARLGFSTQGVGDDGETLFHLGERCHAGG